MRSIEVGAGTVTITDETIQIDIGVFGSVQRFHELSKLFIPFFIFGLLLMSVAYILHPSPYYRFLFHFIIIFTIAGFTLGSVLPRIRNNIGTATEIPRTDVERVEYTSSRLFGLKLRIIVADGETTGVRPVPLAYRQLGEQQLANAKQAFKDAGITVVPADDTDDGENGPVGRSDSVDRTWLTHIGTEHTVVGPASENIPSPPHWIRQVDSRVGCGSDVLAAHRPEGVRW